MRLIDADKIIITRQDYVGALTLPERLRRLLNIQPTVKAIPIEYIEAFKKEFRAVASVKAVIEWLLEEWGKENE